MFNREVNYTDACLTETDKTNGVQSYDGFMKTIKRKSPLPKELRTKPLRAGFPNLTKAQIRRYIDQGVIKIGYKYPFINFHNSKVIVGSLKITDYIFENWYKFYKKHPSLNRVEKQKQKVVEIKQPFKEDKGVFFSFLRNHFAAFVKYKELSTRSGISYKNRKIYEKRSEFHYRKWVNTSGFRFNFHSWSGLVNYIKTLQ